MQSNSANRVVLVGHLGKEPEFRHTANDKVVANFSLATTVRSKNDKGEFVDNTDWHRVVVWGNLAEYVKTLLKGQMVYVEGRITYRDYVDKENIKRYVTEIWADTITILGGRKKAEAGSEAADETPF
ncbi:MAG TPA: single-stranded DNA-binding protein [Candidatus Marinimicrobia bacterium]|nr:single-stranded DNA-binding protein [Candidatus Neomarinimicrobiota bacterium]